MRSLFALSFLLLAGCASSPKPGADPNPRLSAATLEYALPVTKATVTPEIVVVQCEPHAVVRVSLTVTPSSVEGPDKFTLRGEKWTSWRKSRDINVTLHDNRAIKTVNATSSDRTFAIIGNIIKGITTLGGIATDTPSGLRCTPATADALKAVKDIEARIMELRRELQEEPQKQPQEKGPQKERPKASRNPALTVQIVEAINGLAIEAARIKTSKPLTFTLPAKEVGLSGAGGVLVWEAKDLNGSLASTDEQETLEHKLMLAYCLTAPTDPDPAATECDITKAVAAEDARKREEEAQKAAKVEPRKSIACPNDLACDETIVFRRPKTMMLTFVGGAAGYGPKFNRIIKAVTLPVSQQGEVSFLPLNVGLGESRTTGLTLDEYGRPTNFAWKSDARAESISAGVAGTLDAVAAFKKSEDGQDLAQRNAKIADLESQQKYNKLKLCEEIIQSGGFKCPES